MSRYGRLFDDARRIHHKLEALVPGLAVMQRYTPADARRVAREEAEQLVAHVDTLAAELESIEREMGRELG